MIRITTQGRFVGRERRIRHDPHNQPPRIHPRPRHRRGGRAVPAQPAQPRLRQPDPAQAAARHHVQPQRRRPAELLARRGGGEVHPQGEPQAAGAVPGPHPDPARRLRPRPRRRRQPHARHGLSAHRRRAVPRQHPGRLRHPGRLGQGHLHRPGDQEPPPERPGHAHPLRLAGVRRHGPRTRRHLDAHGLRRGQQADRPHRRPVPDVRQLYGHVKDREEPQERPRRRAGRPEEGGRGRQRRGPPAARRTRHVRPRDGAGAEGAAGRRRRPRRPRARARA